ncbi:MAG: choline kinase family protein, partial [Lachnospiraceae bacterium]|nr:choline kinase family protein [Lachnospiraceae bacterium]
AMYINRQPDNQVYEFENLEELRLFDTRYQNRSNNLAMELISQVFQVPESEIVHIRCLKSGMTNKSFLFEIRGRHYICRIPGPGTELLINRKQEKAVYDAVAPLGITERVLYFNGETGYKISEYYEDVRTADSENPEDMRTCMDLIRRFHQAGLSVDHSFDLRERIQFYEGLCIRQGGIPFEDYKEVRQRMNQLLDGIERLRRPKILCHIDPVVDNFLILKDGSAKLIDWEYSGMADPILDIAMCSIYSYYDFEQAIGLLEVYLERKASEEEIRLLTAFMALSGFLWSLWAVYKSDLGEEFGEYTIIMYRYAKNGFRRLAQKEAR